jgi:3-hydroxyisobutyrate dehydrogenase-like beta-hydroxyacid dehydrogenase
MMTETVGWIGLGQMGHRMSRHLAAAGHAMVVADAATTERAPPGAKVARSNAEVAALADTVILSLPDGNASEAVAREIAVASPRKVRMVIDTSTIGIEAAETVAAILAEADIAFVDAPVSGGTAGAEKATLAVMLACPEETYERVAPLLSLMGKPFYVGPKPGQGQAVKLLNNFLSATALAATSEAIAFGVSQGIEMKTILDIVNASTGRNSATDDKFPRRILHRRYDAGFTARLQLKDIRLYLENARAAGISDEIADTVVKVWTEMDTALPGADICEMYPYTRDGRRRTG